MADEQGVPERSFFSENGHIIAIVAVVLVAAGVAYKLHPRSTFAADGLSPRWDATVEQAQAAHMPALVLFTADWCPACRALHENVLGRDDVQNEINGHYMMITVDLTSQGPASVARAQKYGVSGIPTLIRFDADGKETDRVHYIPPEQMISWLHRGQ
ncbi:MAG TPA: thioredoxin fold domain-containing protein [Tepidisphaeraceae bacterium]|jgi:thiol:disulfide interchange protein DsbD|nr:thioredoxin fold domain-containing protein [Tepidisphaeraceae bacterium]